MPGTAQQIISPLTELPVEQFLDHELLVCLADCWHQARGARQLPQKHDFEGAVLKYPKIVPHLTLIEKFSDHDMRLRFVAVTGSTRKARI